MKNLTTICLLLLFSLSISAAEIFNYTSKIITVSCVTFISGKKIALPPFTINAGQNYEDEDIASCQVNVQEFDGSYIFTELGKTTSIFFIEMNGKIMAIEGKKVLPMFFNNKV